MKKLLFILVAALAFAPMAEARIARSYAAKVAFAKTHACPSTHLKKLPCPGWIIDHKWPLCANGIDKPENMRWSTVAESKKKDREEVALCAKMRSGVIPASLGKADLCQAVKREQLPYLAAALCGGSTHAAGSN